MKKILIDNLKNIPGWRTDFDATGKQPVRGQTIGSYATDPTLAGTATVYRPDPNDQAALTEQIRAALAGVKSCTFDLGEDGEAVRDAVRRARCDAGRHLHHRVRPRDVARAGAGHRVHGRV